MHELLAAMDDAVAHGAQLGDVLEAPLGPVSWASTASSPERMVGGDLRLGAGRTGPPLVERLERAHPLDHAAREDLLGVHLVQLVLD